ncbi:MAG TPA: hypothetical protein VF183_07245 [Acidimicrobiales bacterium]
MIRAYECPTCMTIHTAAEPCEPYPIEPPPVRTLELHLDADPELPKKYGKRIKALGGRYGEARGYGAKRIVDVPVDGALGDGIKLCAELVRAYGGAEGRGRTCIIARPPASAEWSEPSADVLVWYDNDRTNCTTGSIDKIIESYRRAWTNAAKAGHIRRKRARQHTALTWRGRRYRPEDAEKCMQYAENLVQAALGRETSFGRADTVEDRNRVVEAWASELHAVAERYLTDPPTPEPAE